MTSPHTMFHFSHTCQLTNEATLAAESSEADHSALWVSQTRTTFPTEIAKAVQKTKVADVDETERGGAGVQKALTSKVKVSVKSEAATNRLVEPATTAKDIQFLLR